MCLGGIWVLIPCSMEPKHYFGTSLKGTTFVHLTILKHLDVKIAVYKLYKNHWVVPFFGIFRNVRDILLVTVAFDHPVSWLRYHNLETMKFTLLLKTRGVRF